MEHDKQEHKQSTNAQANNQYEILNYKQFRKLIERSDDVNAERCGERGGYPIYKIDGNEFIKLAIDLEIIQPAQIDDGNAIILTYPEQLHAFVERVEAQLDGENTVYYVTLRGQRIEFRADEIIDLSIWRKKAAGYTCKLIISFDLKAHKRRDAFNQMIADIIDRAEVVWEEKYSTDEVYAQMIMTEIDKLIMVEDRTSFARNPVAILHENDVRYVKSATIASIVERLRIPYGLEKIRIILVQYMAKSSQRIMIDKKRYSCWVFKEEEE